MNPQTDTEVSIVRKDGYICVSRKTTSKRLRDDKLEHLETKITEDYYSAQFGLDSLPQNVLELLGHDTKHCPDVTAAQDSRVLTEHFEDACLEEINKYRLKHGVEPLYKNEAVTAYAKNRALEMAKKDEEVSRKAHEFGECVYVHIAENPQSMPSPSTVINTWYESGKDYNYNEEPTTLTAGNFTQIIWRSSEFFGIGVSRNKNNHVYIVGAFKPTGNWFREFKSNVFPAEFDERSNNQTSMSVINREAIEIHNEYRKRHNAPPLKYYADAANTAQSWANYLTELGFLKHNPSKIFGENLYLTYGSKPDMKEVCQCWYNEGTRYNYSGDYASNATGHFTQMIWNKTQRIGIGIAKGPDFWVVVANYDPPGNIIGHYKENVSQPM